MIEIFLSKDYDKGLLKAYLEFIKENASRELTYDTNNSEVDVCVNTSIHLSYEEAVEHSTSLSYKGDLVVFFNDISVNEFINGEPVDVDTIYKYIEEM
ncbi:TreE [Staphylococcus phage CF7]|nr:TreE [Staphylococcus phage CF7]